MVYRPSEIYNLRSKFVPGSQFSFEIGRGTNNYIEVKQQHPHLISSDNDQFKKRTKMAAVTGKSKLGLERVWDGDKVIRELIAEGLQDPPDVLSVLLGVRTKRRFAAYEFFNWAQRKHHIHDHGDLWDAEKHFELLVRVSV